MRILSLMLLGTLFLSAQQMQWEQNIPRGNDMPVVVMVEREGCPWCQKMKTQTFNDAMIIKELEGFAVVKMDQARWNRLGFETVQSVPTTFFLDHEKRVIKKVVGFWKAQDFKSDITRVKTNLQ